MSRLLRWLAFSLLALVLSLAALLLVALDDQPLVERSEAISPNAVAQAKRLLALNDPRRQMQGEVRTVAIPAALIDEGVNYLAGRYAGGRGTLFLQGKTAELMLTKALPGQHFLNLRISVLPHEGKPQIASAHLGKIRIPRAMLEFALLHGLAKLGFEKEWQLAQKALNNVAFDAAEKQVRVTYIWEPDILDRAREAAMSETDIKHLREAQLSLAALLAHRAPGSLISLSEVIKASLSAPDNEPSRRGRALLLVLASHLAGKDLAAVVPAARNWPRLQRIYITLAGRYDLAQHFVISAALAAWAGEPVADAIGLYKELEDARHGSGFSFIDLAADRAGTRFGETLLRNPEQLLDVLRAEFADNQLLPDVADLPESLHQQEFAQRFENQESPRFKAMTREIERRLDTLPLYR